MRSTSAVATATIFLGVMPVAAHCVDHDKTFLVYYVTAPARTGRTADKIGPSSPLDGYNDALVNMLLSPDAAQIVDAPEDEDEFMDWVTKL